MMARYSSTGRADKLDDEVPGETTMEDRQEEEVAPERNEEEMEASGVQVVGDEDRVEDAAC